MPAAVALAPPPVLSPLVERVQAQVLEQEQVQAQVPVLAGVSVALAVELPPLLAQPQPTGTRRLHLRFRPAMQARSAGTSWTGCAPANASLPPNGPLRRRRQRKRQLQRLPPSVHRVGAPRSAGQAVVEQVALADMQTAASARAATRRAAGS